MEQFIADLLPKIEHFRLLSYWLIFLASVLETLPFVGIILPGTVILLVAGFLVAQGSFDLGDMIWAAALGAILGDSIAYYLGRYKGRKMFSDAAKIFHTKHLEKAEHYFHGHGGKSIFWGRFISPLRPFIAFVAGIGRMDYKKFLAFNIASGFAWAAAFILLGYFFGASWQILLVWLDRIGLFSLLVIVVIAFNIYLWKTLRKNKGSIVRFFKGGSEAVINAIKQKESVQAFVRRHPRLIEFTRKRLSPTEYLGLHLTIGFAIAASFLYLFISVIEDIAFRDPLYFADSRIINLAQIFRTPFLNEVMLFITYLGKWQIIFSAILIALLILFVRRQYHRMAGLALGVLGGELFVDITKNIATRARPPILNALYVEPTYSFPSGHATVAMTFYGLIAYFLIKAVKSWKTKVAILLGAAFLVFAIGFSRIYLGVHYPSDVLAGYSLGLLWITTVITALEIAERFFLKQEVRPFRIFQSKIVFSTFTIILLLGNVGFAIDFYKSHPLPNQTAQINSAVETIANPKMIFDSLPKSTETLIGSPMEPISLVFIGDWINIKQAFERIGWHEADDITMRSVSRLAYAAIANKQYLAAPVTPSFFNAKPNDFAFESSTAVNTVRERHRIRFWKTNFLYDGKPIFVATASFDIGIKYIITHRIKADIDTERNFIAEELTKSGLVSQTEIFQLVDPTLGKNQSGDQFFTDGKSIVIKTN